jgi:hypothetical protein
MAFSSAALASGAGGAVGTGALGAATAGLGIIAPQILELLFGKKFSFDNVRNSPNYQAYMASQGGSGMDLSSLLSGLTATSGGGGGLPSILQGIPWGQLATILATLGIPNPNGTNSTSTGGTPAGTNPNGAGGAGNGLQTLLQLLGIGGMAGGAALSNESLRRAQEMLAGAASQYSGLGQQGLDRAIPSFDRASAGYGATMDGTSDWQSLIRNALIPGVGQLNSALPGMLERNFADSPEIASALAQLRGGASSGTLQTLLDRASQNMNNGGATADTRDQFAQHRTMQQGGTAAMQSLGQTGGALLGERGMSPALSALLGSGASSASSGGMTPELAATLQQVRSMLGSGGATPTTSALSGRGLQLSAGDPLAPMGLVLSQALDSAGTRQAQAAETARGQAMARGGGPGATVANGVQNQALADFAEQGARGQSEAVRDAMASQQALQLQQTGLGGSMAQSGAALENQRLADLLNSVSGLTATSTGRMGVGGNLALGASGAGTANMGAGTNMLEAFNRGSLGAGSLADALLTLEMGNQRDWGQLGAQGVGQQSGILDSYVRNLLSGAQGGAAAGANLGQLMLSNQDALARILGGGETNYLHAAQGQQGLGNSWLNFGGEMFGNVGPTVTSQSQYAARSPWADFANDAGASLASSGTLSQLGRDTSKGRS